MSDTPKTAALRELCESKRYELYIEMKHVHDILDSHATLERESADLLAALRELVRLKDIKERIERGSELNGEWTDYEVNKEWAWQAARAAIVRYEK